MGSALRRIRTACGHGPVGNSGFRLLAIGQLTSTAGDCCYAVALPWLILSGRSMHTGALLLSIVVACYGLPRTVLVPVSGILADKVGPRRLMIVADVSRCLLVAVLAVFAALRLSSPGLLGPTAAFIGAGEGLFLPASFAIMPTLLEPGQLPAGNALSAAMMRLGALAGPVLGALLVVTAGPGPAFAADAASFGLSALTLAFISSRRPQAAGALPAADAPAGPVGNDRPSRTGPTLWGLLRTSRLLQVVLAVCVAASLAWGGTLDVALPALAHARFGADGYGALLTCCGAGALLGTLYAARAGKFAQPAICGCVAFLAMATATGLLPYLGGLPGAAVAMLVLGATNGFGNVVLMTLLQQWAPARLLGRVMSLVMLTSVGIFPVSVVLAGVLIGQLGPAPVFSIAAGLVFLSVLGALTQREIRMLGTSRASLSREVPDPVIVSTG